MHQSHWDIENLLHLVVEREGPHSLQLQVRPPLQLGAKRRERELLLGKLDMERNLIVKELLEGNTAGLTAKEATAIQLARWQRALELYIYDPPARTEKKGDDKPTSPAVPSGQQDQNDEEKEDLRCFVLMGMYADLANAFHTPTMPIDSTGRSSD